MQLLFRGCESAVCVAAAVSKWIGKLEKELGVTLFVRSREGVTLTEKGKYLYSVWRPLFNTIAKSVQDVQDFGSSNVSTLRIGCIHSVEATGLMRDLVTKYKQLYPDVAIKESIYEYGELNQRLVAGTIDIAISSSFALEGIKHIVYKNITGISLYLAVSASGELAASRTRSRWSF
jgi:DNA-binding transcriptional LysR family regulator